MVPAAKKLLELGLVNETEEQKVQETRAGHLGTAQESCEHIHATTRQ